jgi:hypothetical protein
MKLVATVVAASMLSGCIATAKRQTSQHVVATRRGPVDPGRPLGMTVAVDAVGPELAIAATWRRECRQATFERIEEREETVFDVDGPDGLGKLASGNAWGAVLLIPIGVICAFTFAASAPFAAIEAHDEPVVLGSAEYRAGERVWSCPAPAAGVPFRITLASGAVVQATTDEQGIARVITPDGEPDSGRIRVDGPGASVAAVYYHDEPTQAKLAAAEHRRQRAEHATQLSECKATRKAIAARAAKTRDERERAQLYLSMPDCAVKVVAREP